MSYLKPILQPLKGECRSTSSLVDCEYKVRDGKPILSFSIAIANVGNGPLHIILGDTKEENGKTVAPAIQRMYKDNGEYEEKDVGFFEQHEEVDKFGMKMVHWHYEGIASMHLLNGNGDIVSESGKEGYCLADSFQYLNLPNSPLNPVFSSIDCMTRTDKTQQVGLSIGWLDHYDFNADKQDIPIENVPSGTYYLKFNVHKTALDYEFKEPVSLELSIDHKNKKVSVKRDGDENYKC
jgi:hypothetical protein